MKRILFSMIVFLNIAGTTIQADVGPGPSRSNRWQRTTDGDIFDLHTGTILQSTSPMTIRPAPVSQKTPDPTLRPGREVPREDLPPGWTPNSQITPNRTTPPPRYPYALQVSLSSAEMAPPLDMATLFTEPDIWWSPIPTKSTILGNSPPPGWIPEPPRTDPTPPESTDLADVAPEPPVPEVSSPVPMVIAGLAATAGVVLLGLWIANKGRSGNSQDH